MQRKQDKIEKILKSAEKLFSANYYHNVSTNHIADLSGIPIGTLYGYFSRKSEIAEEIINSYINQTDQIFLRIKKQRGNSIVDAARGLISESVRQIETSPFVLEVMIMSSMDYYPEELTGPLMLFRKRWQDNLCSIQSLSFMSAKATRLAYSYFVSHVCASNQIRFVEAEAVDHLARYFDFLRTNDPAAKLLFAERID